MCRLMPQGLGCSRNNGSTFASLGGLLFWECPSPKVLLWLKTQLIFTFIYLYCGTQWVLDKYSPCIMIKKKSNVRISKCETLAFVGILLFKMLDDTLLHVRVVRNDVACPFCIHRHFNGYLNMLISFIRWDMDIFCIQSTPWMHDDKKRIQLSYFNQPNFDD
jgi:hypothetical protein